MNSTLLINGSEAFPHIIKRLQKARESIIIAMFIWRDDAIGNTIALEALNAADRGVRVHIIKDKVGSIFEKEEENKKSFFHRDCDQRTYVTQKVISMLYFRYLEKRSEQTVNPNFSRMRSHSNISLSLDTLAYDHSKYYLIDNTYLILGGINIEDKELGQDFKNRKYADYMVEITGSDTIAEFQGTIHSPKASTSKTFYVNNREQNLFQIKDKVLDLICQAKESIDIEMAYWGDRDITHALMDAANRGVAVSILTSSEANLQHDLNMQVMSTILQRTSNNVTIYLSERMVHSKFMCIDRHAIFFGSANFNAQGLKKISELNVLIDDDPDVIQKWLNARTEHLAECRQIQDYRDLKYNKPIAFLESLFC